MEPVSSNKTGLALVAAAPPFLVMLLAGYVMERNAFYYWRLGVPAAVISGSVATLLDRKIEPLPPVTPDLTPEEPAPRDWLEDWELEQLLESGAFDLEEIWVEEAEPTLEEIFEFEELPALTELKEFLQQPCPEEGAKRSYAAFEQANLFEQIEAEWVTYHASHLSWIAHQIALHNRVDLARTLLSGDCTREAYGAIMREAAECGSADIVREGLDNLLLTDVKFERRRLSGVHYTLLDVAVTKGSSEVVELLADREWEAVDASWPTLELAAYELRTLAEDSPERAAIFRALDVLVDKKPELLEGRPGPAGEKLADSVLAPWIYKRRYNLLDIQTWLDRCHSSEGLDDLKLVSEQEQQIVLAAFVRQQPRDLARIMTLHWFHAQGLLDKPFEGKRPVEVAHPRLLPGMVHFSVDFLRDEQAGLRQVTDFEKFASAVGRMGRADLANALLARKRTHQVEAGLLGSAASAGNLCLLNELEISPQNRETYGFTLTGQVAKEGEAMIGLVHLAAGAGRLDAVKLLYDWPRPALPPGHTPLYYAATRLTSRFLTDRTKSELVAVMDWLVANHRSDCSTSLDIAALAEEQNSDALRGWVEKQRWGK